MPDRFDFSSRGQDPEAAFAAYRALYAGGSDVTRGDGPFHAEVRAWRLDKMLLFERRLSGVVHARRERVASDAFDHFVITLVISGELDVGAAEPVGPGEIIMFDTRRPMQSQPRDAHLVTASVARDVIEAALGSAGKLHGRVLQPPANLVLADFLTSLARRVDQLDGPALPALGRAFIEVLSSVGAGELRPGREDRRQDLVRRETVGRFVARHLADAALSVESISAGTGISRSSLYRLFEKQGGVARFITRTRLDGVRAALDDGELGAPAELARAYGFADERQLQRMFAEAYGASIEAYRAAFVEHAPDAPTISRRRWAGWMSELD